MLTIKTWCLPRGLSEDKLNELHTTIVNSVVAISETRVRNEGEMLNLFPCDMMNYGLGTEISIEITKVPITCGRAICNKLAKNVGSAVKKMFPKARVECEALPVSSDAGFWFAISEKEQFEQECAEGLHK